MKQKLIREIIFTFLFLIFATLFIYVPKNMEFASSMTLAANMRGISLEMLTDDITMDKYYPVSDDDGLTFNDNIFKVVNKSSRDINYKIKFKTGNANQYDNLISNSNIRYSYKINDGEYSTPATLSDTGIISIETINGKSENIYYFKIWVDCNDIMEIEGKIFQGIIELAI